MEDEFEELALHAPPPALPAPPRRATPMHRLVARLFAAADLPLRARLLAPLLRPLGPLGLMAVAAGAFGSFLTRRAEGAIPLDEVARLSSAQVAELARFVEQVSPEALQQLAALVADNPIGLTGFGAAVAMLMVRALQSGRAARRSRR